MLMRKRSRNVHFSVTRRRHGTRWYQPVRTARTRRSRHDARPHRAEHGRADRSDLKELGPSGGQRRHLTRLRGLAREGAQTVQLPLTK